MSTAFNQAFSSAFNTLKEDSVAWILFGGIYILVGSVVPGIATLMLLPNVLRECNASVSEGRTPVVSAMFDFQHLENDIVSMLLYGLAQFMGLFFCIIGGPIAWVLFWYSPELSADSRTSGADALKVSMAYVTNKPGETIMMALTSVVLNVSAAAVGVGVGIFLSVPFVLLVWTHYWLAIRDDVYATAQGRGISIPPHDAPHQA